MAIRHKYLTGELTVVITDILNATWPDHIKKHLLIKELLWHKSYPRGVTGSIYLEPPIFSAEAKKIWIKNKEEGKKGRLGLILEHAIPRNILCARLVSINKPGEFTTKSVSNFQEKYIHRAFVSKEEDRELDRHGFRSKMPENWNWDDDVWARHRAVGIRHTTWLPKNFSEENYE